MAIATLSIIIFQFALFSCVCCLPRHWHWSYRYNTEVTQTTICPCRPIQNCWIIIICKWCWTNKFPISSWSIENVSTFQSKLYHRTAYIGHQQQTRNKTPWYLTHIIHCRTYNFRDHNREWRKKIKNKKTHYAIQIEPTSSNKIRTKCLINSRHA